MSSIAPASSFASLGSLVRADEGLIDRRIFSDPAIYEQELEQMQGSAVRSHGRR